MANKAALGVLMVIVLVSMGIGILIGMQLGGPAASEPTESDDSGGPTPVPDGGEETTVPTSPPESSPTTQSRATDQAETRTTVGIRRFDDENIESKMEQRINEKRRSRGLDQLDTSGLLATRVSWMARNHSEAMAEERRAIHKIDGQSTADRYRDADLYGACQFQKDGGGDTISPSEKFENVETVNAKFYMNDPAIANDIVDNWFDNQSLQDRLTYENAIALGVGVEITNRGDVYATSNVC